MLELPQHTLIPGSEAGDDVMKRESSLPQQVPTTMLVPVKIDRSATLYPDLDSKSTIFFDQSSGSISALSEEKTPSMETARSTLQSAVSEIPFPVQNQVIRGMVISTVAP